MLDFVDIKSEENNGAIIHQTRTAAYTVASTIGYIHCAMTHVDHPCCIALFEVIQHSGLIKVGHHGHVLDLVKLGRVHGEHVAIVHCYNLGEEIHQSYMEAMFKKKKKKKKERKKFS